MTATLFSLPAQNILMNEQEEIKKVLLASGADMVGFADASAYFKEYTTAIVMTTSTKRIYGLGRKDMLHALNEIMDYLGLVTRQWLQDHGYGYGGPLFSQEENPCGTCVPHRELAIDAGVGVRGKNDLVITEAFGPRIQITTVLTTMPFLKEKKSLKLHPCKKCNACVRACPTDAIGSSFEREKCIFCFKCVLHCPTGRDFEEVKRYLEIKENIWRL